LLLENEDSLFDFIEMVSKQNESMKSLIKFVQFPALSKSTMKRFIENNEFQVFLPSLNERICMDVIWADEEPKRWRTQSSVISTKEELLELKEMLKIKTIGGVTLK
jgi:hypothetical protein